MTRGAAAVLLLALVLVGGAQAAGGGSVGGSVVPNPLQVTLALSSGSSSVGAQSTATATAHNLGAVVLANVVVTLSADPNLAVAGGTIRTIGSIAGGGSAQVSWQVCPLGPGGFVVLAEATAGSFSAGSPAQVLSVSAGPGQCPEDASASLPAGGTLSTDREGDGATSADPVETAVSTQVAGVVSITEGFAAATPTAFSFLGQQVQISAPAATAARPLRLVFRLDASLGASAATVQVFRNGVQVTGCSGAGATPDPCVSGRAARSDGDVELTVLTSAASTWTFGKPILSRAAVAGVLQTSNGAAAAFLASSDGRVLKGAFAYKSFQATQLTALAVTGRKAWLAGVGADGRTFLAYMEDNGPNGHGDVFKLLIGGAQQTGDGRLAKGDVGVTG
jgi:hypothetical protein